MLPIPNVRADSDLVGERSQRHHGESDSLVRNLSVDSRIGGGAGGRVLYIHETGGQRLHHFPKTVGETDVADGYIYIKLIIRGNDLLTWPVEQSQDSGPTHLSSLALQRPPTSATLF